MVELLRTSTGLLYQRDFGGTGQPVVLVHGLGGSTTNYLTIAPRLRQHGHVTAIDLPGFGLSPPRANFKLSTHIEALESYLEGLNEPAVLVGNSTGGLLSQMLASRRDDLVDRLILISPATPPVFPDPLFDWSTAWRLALQGTPILGDAIGKYFIRRFTPEELVRLTLEMVTFRPGHVPIEIVEASIDLTRIRFQLAWTAQATARTATSIGMTYLRRSEYVRMLRQIRTPTLVIHGLEDHHVSPTAISWACSLRPDWQLIQMERTGHTPQLDAPLRTAGIISHWLVDSDSEAPTATAARA